MKEILKTINNEVLNSIDMSRYLFIENKEYQEYFQEKSSKEHYRLLTHISTLFNSEIFLDVGTLKGCSALALSTNQTNNVYSFNLSDQKELSKELTNVEFIIDDVINGAYDELIMKSKLILLDTYHDGTFEIMFYNHLKSLGYKGTLILDDIHLNNEMELFWNSIKDDKYDITNIGHATGTGVVIF
jgi:hypothetical protein